jgi:transmembrane 9 superfamily member 2/4
MGGPVPDDSRYNSTSNETVYLYNHVNIQVEYRKQQDNKSYQILRTVMEPYSVQQYSATDGSVILASCDSSQQLHTKYEMLSTVPVQPATGKVRFTYDVQWIESTEGSFSKRWNVFLNMDGAVPPYIEVMGCFLGGFFLVVLTGVLYTWVRRDLSYKPVVDQIVEDGCTEEETTEIQMWPLSTRIFFPPTNAPALLCIACGTGAQLLVAGFLIVVFFRVGIISQAQGAKLLTPCIILYAFCSVVGGYVTARLCTIFHGELKVALASCLVTAIAYPLMGMLVSFLAYDVFPDSETPSYRVMANSTPLVLLWIFFVWPVTVGGGYLGYRGGSIQNFPVSEGSTGYQDLNLQDDSENKREQERKRGKWASCHKRYRIAILLAIGGLLPVLSCFVSYSYGVVGPIFLGFYSLRSYTIASYLLFVLVSGAVAVLLYYRQIRAHVYEWWWAAFAAAGSAGIYIFLLSMSYMLFRSESHVSGNTKALYLFWFAYISFGLTLATGFTGVAVCMWFNRAMYTYIMNSH